MPESDRRALRGLSRIAMALALSALAGAAYGQTTWFVDDDACPGPGAGDENDPFCTIGAGLEAASDGDTVEVADGSYTGADNRNLDFLGRRITLRSANGPEFCTIDLLGAGRGFSFHSGEGPDSVVDGFTIANGLNGGGGAGVICDGSDPTLSRCIFRDNNAGEQFGGAVYNLNGSEPLIEGCTFLRNSAGAGGAIANVGSAPTVIDCLFEDNTAVRDFGGGMFSSTGSAPVILRCVFFNNRTLGGGPDQLGGHGGGMYFSAGTATVVGCSLLRNEAEIGGLGRGGGIFVGTSDAEIIDCVFQGNAAQFGGGLACILSSPRVVNGLFVGNVAVSRAGAVYAASVANVGLEGCTIAGNESLDDAGAIFTTASAIPVISNSIVWGNMPNQIVGLADAVFSDVQGGFPGLGNIDAPPLFVRDPSAGPDGQWGTEDDDYGNPRLTSDSPAVDSGNPLIGFDPEETDLDGHARVLCDGIDMGAFESGLGDFNCDGIVNLIDFGDWLTCLTGPDAGPYGTGCEAFDADADEDVDWADFADIQPLFHP